jgi:hypothetical protein
MPARYLFTVAERASIMLLLSNYACHVAQRGARSLYFHCSGLVVTGFFLIWAAVAALSLVAFVMLVMAGGDAQFGLIGSLMAISLAVWSTHLAVARYRRHGRFELDGDKGVLRRFRAGRCVGEFHIADITRVWLALDATDTIRLEQPPSWLQVCMKSGEVFRLAKGTRTELEPVCDVMREMGLAPS